MRRGRQRWGVVARPANISVEAPARTTLLDQDGGTTTYVYDPRGQLAAVQNPFAETTTWSWDALGREQRQTLANGVTVSMSYDGGGRATSRVYRDLAGLPLTMYTATYDAVGNRVGVAELDGTFAYVYDPSRQLVAEHRTGTSAYAYTFTYDGVGNRLTQMSADGAVTSYTYNPASELLGTELGGALTTFAYDAVGNTTEEVGESSTTYTWDPENRLVEVDDDGSPETYAYDATGLRRRKTAGEGTTNFVWDRVNLLSELDASLDRIAQYTDFAGVWGGLSSQRRSGTSSHYGFDLSANTRALLDGGAITDSYLYRAFGVESAVSGSTANSLRFGGQVGYYRDLAERVYVRARHYRPGAGRWVSRDPLAAQASRLQAATARVRSIWQPSAGYGYSSARPVLAVDPLGLMTCDEWRALSKGALVGLDFIANVATLLVPGIEKLKQLLLDVGGSLAAGLTALIGLIDCLLAVGMAILNYVQCVAGWCELCEEPQCRFCPPYVSCTLGIGLSVLLAVLALLVPGSEALEAAIVGLSIAVNALLAAVPEPCAGQ